MMSYQKNGWQGTAAELLKRLGGHGRDWPASPRALSGLLNRLAPSLRTHGITIEIGRTHGGRFIKMVRDETPGPAHPTVTTDTPTRPAKAVPASGATPSVSRPAVPVSQTPPPVSQNAPPVSQSGSGVTQNPARDGRDAESRREMMCWTRSGARLTHPRTTPSRMTLSPTSPRIRSGADRVGAFLRHGGSVVGLDWGQLQQHLPPFCCPTVLLSRRMRSVSIAVHGYASSVAVIPYPSPLRHNTSVDDFPGLWCGLTTPPRLSLLPPMTRTVPLMALPSHDNRPFTIIRHIINRACLNGPHSSRPSPLLLPEADKRFGKPPPVSRGQESRLCLRNIRHDVKVTVRRERKHPACDQAQTPWT